MVPLKSFLMHFNFPHKLKGERNTYNKKHQTLLYKIVSFFLWILLLPLKILDIIGFYFLLDFLRRIFIANRCLSDFEKTEARKVFGDAINLDRIRICERSGMARIGAKSAGKKHIGFVLFRTINFSRPLDYSAGVKDMAWLIHEIVHVIQFKHLGVQYIFEALRAQRNGGYAYGGLGQLERSNRLSEFNLEQQADVARDYYLGVITKSKNAEVLKRFVDEIKAGKF